MARARNIKPSFFKSEQVADCCPHAQLLFIGLWTLADREGRLHDRPRTIKAEVFPFNSELDCHVLLQELHNAGLVIRYADREAAYIFIPNFQKHQKPHPNEAPSQIPEFKGLTSAREKVISAREKEVSAQAECGMLNADVLKDESGGDGADAPRGNYASEGETFRVTYEDMDKLVKANPYIYVLPHLKGIDATYAKKKACGESVKGVWFAVRAALVNANQEARAKMGEVAL